MTRLNESHKCLTTVDSGTTGMVGDRRVITAVAVIIGTVDGVLGHHGWLRLNENECARGTHSLNGEKGKQGTYQAVWHVATRTGAASSTVKRTIGKGAGESVDGCRGQEECLRAHIGYLHEDDVGREVFGARTRSSA